MSSLRTKARRVLESRVVQVKTKSVEEMLLPFIEQVIPLHFCKNYALRRSACIQVSTLRSWQPSSMRKKGRFRNIQTFIQLVHKATSNFLDVGRKIANQNPSIRVSWSPLDVKCAYNEIVFVDHSQWSVYVYLIKMRTIEIFRSTAFISVYSFVKQGKFRMKEQSSELVQVKNLTQ